MQNVPPSAAYGPLVRFYRGEGPDAEGRFLREIRGWNAGRLEAVHDYIQWLFPTRQRSRFNADAPELGAEEILAFQNDEKLRAELVASLRQMLTFYGFALREENGQPEIRTAEDWPERREEWFHPGDHNLLRVTRILDCLNTLGLPEHARAFLAALEQANIVQPSRVPVRTLDFWRDAVKK